MARPQPAKVALTVIVEHKATTPDDDKHEALARLLGEELPALLATHQPELRLVGDASIVGEDVADLLERFRPGQPFELTMEAEAWPELPTLTRADYFGLDVELRRPPMQQDKLDEAMLELRRRYPRDDGSLEPETDALAARVSTSLATDGAVEAVELTMADLRQLVRDRVERELALRSSSAALVAVEEALLAAVPVAPPRALVMERARAQYAARIQLAEREAVGGGDAERAALQEMMNFDAFNAYFAAEEAANTRSLALSFAIEAVASAEQLTLDQQAIDDNLELYVIEQQRNGRPAPDRDDPVFRETFAAEYLREHLLKFLLDHARVEWVD